MPSTSGQSLRAIPGHVAGIAALILALQPLVTAMIAAPLLGERCVDRSGSGSRWPARRGARRLAQDRPARAQHAGARRRVHRPRGHHRGDYLPAHFCPAVDLPRPGVVQFVATLAVLAHCGCREGFPCAGRGHSWAASCSWFVLASILAVNALHLLMRPRSGDARDQPALPDTDHRRCTRVGHVRCAADVADSAGIVVTVPASRWSPGGRSSRPPGESHMTLRLARIIGFVVLTHTAFGAARVTSSLYALSNKASTFTVGS